MTAAARHVMLQYLQNVHYEVMDELIEKHAGKGAASLVHVDIFVLRIQFL